MTQCIHYEDNIFMFLDLLKHIERGLKLDIDDDYYGEKIISDLLFVESGLHRLFMSLKESTLQLDRDHYFRLLYKAAELFGLVTRGIYTRTTGRSIDFSGFVSSLEEKSAVNKDLLNEIQILISSNNKDEEDTDQISQEEMLFLMSDSEEPGKTDE